MRMALLNVLLMHHSYVDVTLVLHQKLVVLWPLV